MQIKRGGGGFTLAELLIVMAIIVVLAAVAIPTFTRQLETSRETGDMELIRSAYTEALAYAVQDASDGKFDGKIGNTALLDDTGDTDKKAAVAYDKTNEVSGNQSGSYIVRISNIAKGAKFSQNGTEAQTSSKANTAFDSTTNKWSYVNNKLYDIEVPPVNTAIDKLTFKFKFDENNEVVPDGGTEASKIYLFKTASS